MKGLGYGKGYRYAHNEAEGIAADMPCLPPAHHGRTFYEPTDRGFESEIRRRISEWRRKKGPS
jgi:putative ATPase